MDRDEIDKISEKPPSNNDKISEDLPSTNDLTEKRIEKKKHKKKKSKVHPESTSTVKNSSEDAVTETGDTTVCEEKEKETPIKNGIRVLRNPLYKDMGYLYKCKSLTGEQYGHDGELGTIIKYERKNSSESWIEVDWDNLGASTFGSKDGHFKDLLVYDTSFTGDHHQGVGCDSCNEYPIKSFRWKCCDCEDYDLCTDCYMSNKHNIGHQFFRILKDDRKQNKDETATGKIMSPRFKCGFTTTVKGFFPGCGVKLLEDDTFEGRIEEIESWEGISGIECTVKWKKPSRQTEKRKLQNLVLQDSGERTIYYEHLPNVEDFLEVQPEKIKRNRDRYIAVEVPRERASKSSTLPTVLMLFAKHPEDEHGNDTTRLLSELIQFYEYYEIPCGLISEGVVICARRFAIYHNKTSNETIQFLLNEGFTQLTKGYCSAGKKCCTASDLLSATKDALQVEGVLPIYVSLKRGGFSNLIMKNSQTWGIPIISIKKSTQAISVFLPTYSRKKKSLEFKEYFINKADNMSVSNGGRKFEVSDKEEYCKLDEEFEVQFISEIEGDIKLLIFYSILAVEDGKTEQIRDVLGAMLLTSGEWWMQANKHSNGCIGLDCVRYIVEEDELFMKCFEMFTRPALVLELMNLQFLLNGFSDGLSPFSLMDNVSFASSNDTDFGDSILFSCLSCMSSCLTCKCFRSTSSATDPFNSGGSKDVYKWIFYALLLRKCYKGAEQLVENGYLPILPILYGCAILKTIAEDWRTSKSGKEEALGYYARFSERCLTLLHGLGRDKLSLSSPICSLAKIQEDLDGRVLINHGYLKVAIMLENKEFLQSSTVKTIVNNKWFVTRKGVDVSDMAGFQEEFFSEVDAGNEGCCSVFQMVAPNFQSSKKLMFLLLLLHPLIVPLLMINSNLTIRHCLYASYQIPFMKLLLHVVGFLTMAITYSYMLVFDYNDQALSTSDIILLVFMISFALEEIKQFLVACYLNNGKEYRSSLWNWLDWCLIILYVIAMVLKPEDGKGYKDASRALFVLDFILCCVRFLHLFTISEILGPLLVMIKKMFRDTLAFLLVMTVLTMCYNVAFYALLYPNAPFTWSELEKLFGNGFWIYLGEFDQYSLPTKITDECTTNITLVQSGSLQRCPDQLGVDLIPYLQILYGLLAIVLMLNLLIATYSHTFNEVKQESDLYWSLLQVGALEEYSLKSIFPFHLIGIVLCALPFILLGKLIMKIVKKCKGRKSETEEQNNTDEVSESSNGRTEATPKYRISYLFYNEMYVVSKKEPAFAKEKEKEAAIKTVSDTKSLELQRSLQASKAFSEQQGQSNKKTPEQSESLTKAIIEKMNRMFDQIIRQIDDTHQKELKKLNKKFDQLMKQQEEMKQKEF